MAGLSHEPADPALRLEARTGWSTVRIMFSLLGVRQGRADFWRLASNERRGGNLMFKIFGS